MALFKLYYDVEENFSQDFNVLPFHDGYAYFLTDKSRLYIDCYDGDNQPIRKIVNTEIAGGLSTLDPEHPEEYITINDLYLRSEIDRKVQAATTVSYEVVLALDGWIYNEELRKFVYTYENDAIRCGVSGRIPPMIMHTGNEIDWLRIDEAFAIPGVGIEFYSTYKPSDEIPIIIIDNA